LLGSAAAQLELRLRCGPGTYVRVLGEDLARALGTCGHVQRLRREWVAPFAEYPMTTLDALESGAVSLPAALLSVSAALPQLPAVALEATAAKRLLHGQSVANPRRALVGSVLLLDSAGRCLGLGEACAAGRIAPKRLFVRPV
ncbi:MAG: tRNA pseudouridine(55) synthase TruB, partial [Steroidobacteraceae bacterium]|nr:tRNA pseudouridine(55) synthase TruB [Steroidobacteraceae bacterium]